MRVKTIIFLGLIFITIGTARIQAQSVSFALATSPNITFDFNTIQKYEAGITIMNACTLNIEAVGTQWDLYVGATTTNIGFWDVTSTDGSNGISSSCFSAFFQKREKSFGFELVIFRSLILYPKVVLPVVLTLLVAKIVK